MAMEESLVRTPPRPSVWQRTWKSVSIIFESRIATVGLMSVVRHVVRDEYLKPEFTTSALEVDSQTAMIVLFFVLLAAGVGVIGYMLRALLQAPRRT